MVSNLVTISLFTLEIEFIRDHRLVPIPDEVIRKVSTLQKKR